MRQCDEACRSIVAERRTLLGCMALTMTLAVAAAGYSGEPYLEFLRGLERRGYGEAALDYLDSIADRNDLPVELKQTLDLERSRSLRIAASEAYDSQQRAARLAEADRLLEKFLSENPHHPAVGSAVLISANEELSRGQISLTAARQPGDEERSKRALADAKTLLISARGHFEAALKRLKGRADATIAAKDTQSQKDAELSLLEARFNLAYTDYLLAQTTSGPEDDERKKLLTAAAEQLDAIFQEYRGQRVGYLAHLWHGKAIEELGDQATAMDYYDEVLVGCPSGKEATADDAPIFGQAALFRLRLISKKEPGQVVKEGDEWLQEYPKWQSTSVFQGIALEVAKLKIAAANAAKAPAAKTKLLREALVALTAIGKIESEHRREAMLLRREVTAKLGTGEGLLTLGESIVMGDEAAAAKNWSEAVELYGKAAEAANKARDAKQAAAIAERVASVRYYMAVEEFRAGKLNEAFASAAQVFRDHPESPIAKEACGLGVAAALQIYLAAPDAQKREAQEKLTKLAEFTIGRWPDQPEGDDARMALAQIQLQQGNSKAALELLTKVNAQSKRYASAQYVAGQLLWKQYLDGKKSENAAERKDELSGLREQARASLTTSVERLKGQWQSPNEPMPQALFDAQLVLAEIYSEGEQSAKAAELYAPLVKDVESRKAPATDVKTLRLFVGAVKALARSENAVAAARTADTLASLGGDAPQLNAVLIDFVRLLEQEAKKLEATAGAQAPSFDASAAKDIQEKLSAVREAQNHILAGLVERKQLSAVQLVTLGDLATALNQQGLAKTAYERVIQTVDASETDRSAVGDSMTRVRARLVGLLRSDGKLEEARRQVEELIKTHPTALEPLMQKGFILQALAEKDPKLYDECVAHWTSVRVLLGRSQPRPPEYYEVLYQAAYSLVRQAEQTRNGELALQAQQMLKSTLVLTPKLSGPQMVAKYDALLTQAAKVPKKAPATSKSGPKKK